MRCIENGMLTPWISDHYETEDVPVLYCDVCGHGIHVCEDYYDDEMRTYCQFCWDKHSKNCKKTA